MWNTSKYPQTRILPANFLSDNFTAESKYWDIPGLTKGEWVRELTCEELDNCGLTTTTTTATTTTTIGVGTCADWAGDWTLNYGSKCDNVTFTVCNNEDASNPSCLPTKAGETPQTYWLCIARGKRQSDNKTVQIRRIVFYTTSYMYYEKTDDEIFATGGDTPVDYIPVAVFLGTSFTVDNTQAPPQGNPLANSGLARGTKGFNSDCQQTTTTTQPTTTTTIGSGTATTTIAASTTTTTVSGRPCPAKQVLGENNPNLENLRDFRDSRLAQNAVGRRIIGIYYKNAGSINAALERSPALRAIARRVLEVIAPMVGVGDKE
jgi:hypothetical protein